MQIIKQGKRPAPSPPAWFLSPLDCPRCKTIFRLDEGDVNSPGGFLVTTDPIPNGKERITGVCPVCHEQVTIHR